MPGETNPDVTLGAYLRSFFSHWITGMCGPLSVPFAAIALWVVTSHSLRMLWGFLAVSSFLLASFLVWRKDIKAISDKARTLWEQDQAEVGWLKADIANMQKQIAALNRKPYNEELERSARELLTRLSKNGERLLRHLLQNEPLEVGRRFLNDISDDQQSEQLGIAMGMGIVRHHEVRAGSGMLLRTDYGINERFRPVLEDLLYG
jgi:hypothetical protein